jgi:hypothetical protein
MVDAAKAQELRLEGNEHFKAGRDTQSKHIKTISNISNIFKRAPFSRG